MTLNPLDPSAPAVPAAGSEAPLSAETAVTLTEDEKATISLYLHPCNACRQGTTDVDPCECRPWFLGIEEVLAARLEPVWAILHAWEAWDGSLGPDGRTHPDASSPRDRDRLRSALTIPPGVESDR